MKKSFLLVILLFLLCRISYAQIQPTLPPSPAASALAKYVDTPVSLYTGTPRIGIPIYTVELKDFSLPISLSYNPQNIQVETVASNVGLGWSLNAGGLITRAVRDVPDDEHPDYCPSETTYNKVYDYSHLGDGFSNCNYGYLYAISEGKPINSKHLGISTYNLDLDAIYDNRKTTTPEEAIIQKFGYPFWGIPSVSGYEFNEEQSVWRFINPTMQYDVRWLVDREPDIFYFNFGDYSGKFVFDVENGSPKIRTIPYHNIEFTYETDPLTKRLESFTAIDSKGIIYKFQEVESTSTVKHLSGPSGLHLSKYNNNSSWWLSKIETPLGEKLTFEYDEDEVMTYSEGWYSGITSLLGTRNPSAVISQYFSNEKRIKAIRGSQVDIQFDDGHSRQDHSGVDSKAKAITSIIISYKSHITSDLSQLKKFVLDYDYFTSSEEQNTYYTNLAPTDGRKRLRLKSIQEFGTENSNSIPKFEFEYNYFDQGASYASHLKFPNKYTYNTDIWGYANGSDNDTPLPSWHFYPDHYSQKGDLQMFSIYEKYFYRGRHFFIEEDGANANRIPNDQYMDIGVLTKIFYPTGGSTTYSYEPHSFTTDGQQYIGGGLRIKDISKYDGQSSINYNYRYTTNSESLVTSGRVVSFPLLFNLPKSRNLIISEDITKYPIGIFAYSVAELGRTAGSNIGYTNVIEYISNSAAPYENGRTEYRFSFPAQFAERNDLNGNDCTLAENGICDALYATTRVHNFFMYGDDRPQEGLDYYSESSLSHLTPPNPNYNWNRGHLLEKKIYNASDNLVREEINTYKNYYPLGATEPCSVYGMKMVDIDVETDFEGYEGYFRNYAFRVAKYELLTNVAKVLSSTTISDYEVGTANLLSNTTIYSYEGDTHKNVTKIEEETSSSDKLITKFRYPNDYVINVGPLFEPDEFTEGIVALRSKHINDIPIEVSRYRKKNGKEHLLTSEITLYKTKDDLSVPTVVKKVESSKLLTDFDISNINQYGHFIYDPNYSEKTHISKYDEKGNILEIIDKSKGLTTSYIWGYNKKYVIAKVVNASYVELQSILGSHRFNLLNYGYAPYSPFWITSMISDSEIRGILSDLRTSLPKSMVYFYTYGPLRGLNSETDPRGQTTYYKYDNLNRLYQIKDQDSNILKQFKYHYKEQ